MEEDKDFKRLVLGDSIVKHMALIVDANVYAFSGARIEDLQNIVFNNPTLLSGITHLIIHCGTNNIQRASCPAEIVDRLKGLFDEIQIIDNQIKLLYSSILPRPIDDLVYGELVQETNKAIWSYCETRDIYFIASYKQFVHSGLIIQEYYEDDNLHINTKGNSALTDRFRQKFGELGSIPQFYMSGKNNYFKKIDWIKRFILKV